MDNIKTRKFSYEIEMKTENINSVLENLKKIEYKYHIFGMDKEDNSITGFICFMHPRRIKSVKQLLHFCPDITVTRYEAECTEIIEEIREIGNIWEKGEIPKKSKGNYGNNSLAYMCNFIMKQHQQLIEDTMTQRNQLLQENIKLRETALHLQQTNIEKLETSNTKMSNSNNKTFNINVFLNEECKNAITLVDFIKTLEVETDDLLYAKDHGFAEAVTRMLENGLKKYDLKTRPLHCTDIKRETMHIKEDAGWVREQGDLSKLNKAIRCMSKKNMDKVVDYIEENGCEIGSRQYEKNLEIMKEIADGASDKYNKKIIKNIANLVHLEEDI